MSLKLFYSPGACSLASHIVLIEGKLKYAIEKVDIGKKVTASGDDFYKVNPRGAVPAIQLEDGQVITQGPAVLQYLGTKGSAPGMNPEQGSIQQARIAEALAFCSDLHSAFGPFFNPKLAGDERQAAFVKWQRRMKELDEWLATSKSEFWLGPNLTQPDVYAAVCLNWGSKLKLDISPYANAAKLYEKVFSRPAAKQALEEEGVKQ